MKNRTVGNKGLQQGSSSVESMSPVLVSHLRVRRHSILEDWLGDSSSDNARDFRLGSTPARSTVGRLGTDEGPSSGNPAPLSLSRPPADPRPPRSTASRHWHRSATGCTAVPSPVPARHKALDHTHFTMVTGTLMDGGYLSAGCPATPYRLLHSPVQGTHQPLDDGVILHTKPYVSSLGDHQRVYDKLGTWSCPYNGHH